MRQFHDLLLYDDSSRLPKAATERFGKIIAAFTADLFENSLNKSFAFFAGETILVLEKQTR
jgi:hypothetical protein